MSEDEKFLPESKEKIGKYGSECSLNPVPGESCNCEPESIPRKVFTRSFTVAPRPKNSVNFRQGQLESIKSQRDTSSIDCNTKKNDSTLFEIKPTPSLAIDQEGIVEIHIISLQLTPFAINQLYKDEKKSQPSLFVTCDFCGQGNIFVPHLKYPNLDFKTSHTYKLSSINNFLDCVVWQAIHLQIYAINPGGYPCAVAHAKVCVKDILNYPQIKLHYNAIMNCIVPCYRDSTFGQLSFWIRLNCNIECINEFKSEHSKNQRNRDSDQLNYEKSLSMKKLKKFSDEKSQSHCRLGKRKISDFCDSSKSPGASKRASISYQSEPSFDQGQDDENDRVIPNEKRRESWSTWSSGDYKLKDNRINQKINSNEFGELSPNDPASGIQLRDTSAIFSNNKFRFRRKSSTSYRKNNNSESIVLKIKHLTLLPGCSIFQDPNIHQLYIEFSFLGYHGLELETESLPKPASPDDGPLSFNYEKQFFFDEETHLEQRNKLCAMLSGDANPNIKFTIVSEPLREEMNIKDCLEVGFAYLNIREHILRNEVSEISLIVLNTTETNSIGNLEVAIVDSGAMRQLLKN